MHFRAQEQKRAAELDPRVKLMPPGPERDGLAMYGNTPEGRRAKCVLDLYALEANEPVRVPCWYFGGRGFPHDGEEWHDWGQAEGYWMRPDDTIVPAF